jgi:hypothetical protein
MPGIHANRGTADVHRDVREHVEQGALAHPARSVHEQQAGIIQRGPEQPDFTVTPDK